MSNSQSTRQTNVGGTSPRRTTAATSTVSEPKRIDITGGYQPAQEPEKPKSPRKFDSNIRYDPHNVKKAYKDEHERPSMPTPPRGQAAEPFKMPDSVRAFTGLKVVQEPEKPKVGVYLGPTGHTAGGAWATQQDVRRKQPIGAPEVSTKAHVGSAASSVSTVTILTAGAPTFQERVTVNTSCLDLIAACVRQLGIVFPASNFGMISRAPGGDSWVPPDTLAHEIGSGVQLIVVPKESTSQEIKKAYFASLAKSSNSAATSQHQSDSNWTPDDVQGASNAGAQKYYAY